MTALHALCVHAEGIVSGARVAVLGDARLDLGARLMELGARAVHVFDPVPERARGAAAAGAPPSVAYHALSGGALDVRDGAFDAVVVPDLAALPSAEGVAREIRRVLSPEGVALVLARAHVDTDEPIARDLLPEVGPASLTYTTLFDEFSLQFAEVTLSGVLPFRGVIFAELGRDEEDGIAVDGRLAEGEATNVFVVCAAGDRPEMSSYAIVQLPLDDRAGDVGAQRAAFAHEQLRAQLLTSQVEQERARVASLEAKLAAPRPAAVDPEKAALAERCVALEAAVVAHREELDRVGRSASELLEARADLERRAEAANAALLDRDDEIAKLRAHLDALHAEPGPDDAALRAAEQRAHRAEAALTLHLSDVEPLVEAHAHEISSLERQLRDRARVIATLENELLRRERLVQELIGMLEEARHGGHAPAEAGGPSVEEQLLREERERLVRKLDALAADAARREGELVAQAWRITELERDVARAREEAQQGAGRPGNGAPAGRADEPKGPADIAAALDELDALRLALAQEHADRVEAESGGALTKARAELQRQSALLEQLRRSRDA